MEDKCIICNKPATHIHEYFQELLCDNKYCEAELIEGNAYIENLNKK